MQLHANTCNYVDEFDQKLKSQFFVLSSCIFALYSLIEVCILNTQKVPLIGPPYGLPIINPQGVCWPFFLLKQYMQINQF